MEKTMLREGESFNSAKERIAQQVVEDLHSDPRFSQIDDRLLQLDGLREHGLYAVRENRANIDRLTADHNLAIKRQKTADKLASKASDREAKRQVVALRFKIREMRANLTTETRKEYRREVKFIAAIAPQAKAADPAFIRIYADELPLAIKGLDLLERIDELTEKIQSHKDVQPEQIDALAKAALKPGSPEALLAAKVSRLSARGQAKLSSQEMKKLAELKRAYAKLNRTKPAEFVKSLVALCHRAYTFGAERPIRQLECQQAASACRIKGQHRIDARKAEKAAQKRLKVMAEDQTFHEAISVLEADTAEAKRIQRQGRRQCDALADEAYDLCRDLFDEKLSELIVRRRESRAYLNAHLKEFIKAHRGDRAAIAAESERVYRQLALAGVAQDALLAQRDRVRNRISASVHQARHHAPDADITRYYEPIDVVRDPSLVDTANMRLVIKGQNKQIDVKAVERRDRALKGVYLFFIYLFLCVCAILVLFPFYWMINTSLKSTEELVNSVTPTLWPETVMWSNYVDVFDRFDFLTYLSNTLVVGICSTIGVLLTCIFSAFAFARLKFKGRDTLFMVFLATMMIPGEMMVITNYITVANFGWIGSEATRLDAYLSMIMPFCVSVFYIYLLRQNFKQIPEELYLAAKVDGKSDWSFLWKVMVPLCQPTLITIGILELMGSWNAYVWPNLVAGKDEYRLISNGLRNSFTTASGIAEYGLQMAATVYVTVPLLLLFIFFRKYIMKGMGRAGIKG